MFNWIMLGMIILGAGAAMIVVNKNFDVGKWFSLLSSFLILGGTGVATAGVLNAIRRAPGISGPPEQKSLPTNPVPNELPSITERTTQLIPAEEAQAREAGDSIKPGAQAPG